MKKTQYKALKIIYNTNESYDELFIGSNEVSIHQKTYALVTEICKSVADINPDFMSQCFMMKEMLYNLRNGCALKLPSTNSL